MLETQRIFSAFTDTYKHLTNKIKNYRDLYHSQSCGFCLDIKKYLVRRDILSIYETLLTYEKALRNRFKNEQIDGDYISAHFIQRKLLEIEIQLGYVEDELIIYGIKLL